jgi:hypothetical protein
MRTGFFTYPWDLLDEGPEQVIDAMVTRYGCNALALNCNYHHARLLRPRAQGRKTLELPGAIAAFEPQPKWYTPGGLIPVPEPRLAEANVIARARAACTARGIDLGLWIVGLHNSTLGQQHPEWCLCNCFGDVYTYALCPSRGEVQAFLRGLVGDVCSQFHPDRVLLEAVGYMGMRHGVHHELFMTGWSESLELLLSLCFCEKCAAHAQQSGICVEELRTRVAGIAERLLNEERDSEQAGGQSEAASLLMEIPNLTAYIHSCADQVTELVSLVHDTAQAFQVALEVIPSSFHRPSSRAWIEHAPLADLSGVSDGLVVLTYFDNTAQVIADLNWARTLVPQAHLVAGLNACAPTIRDQSVLTGQARAARDAGCAAVYVYNYGLLTPRRLDWVGRAFRTLHDSGTDGVRE